MKKTAVTTTMRCKLFKRLSSQPKFFDRLMKYKIGNGFAGIDFHHIPDKPIVTQQAP